MDIDEQQHSSQFTLQPTNALAGPSSSTDILPIYLPPPGPPQRPPYLTSSQDLISRFQLLPAYDKYVRPYAPPVGQPSSIASATDKGKGKEKELSHPPGATPVPVADGEDEEAKGEKKWKNSYKQFIKGIPGKHSMKKDDYLTTLISVPPKQRIAITPFDLKTQREAFSVSLEGLKGWNINALVAESPQAREDRKKRKELKKLAKAQGLAAIGTPSASGVPATPAPFTASTPSAVPPGTRTATPKPGVMPARAAPPISQQNVNPGQPRGRTPVGIGTPQSAPTPGPGPTPALSSSALATTLPPRSALPSTPAASQALPDPSLVKRGVKRERDQSIDGMGGNGAVAGQGHAVNGMANGNGTQKPTMVVGAKAGNGGVRPRPLKKPRVDMSQTRELPVQQPTPHA